MEVLIGLGFAAVCLQLAVSPALIAAAWIASSNGRSSGALGKAMMAFAGLCGLASMVLLAVYWPVLGLVLRLSAVSLGLAALGGAVVLRISYLALRRAFAPKLGDLRVQSADCHPELSAALLDAADAVGLCDVPRLAVVECTASPAVTGFFRPVLLFPARLSELEPDHLRIVLIHELAHLKRRHLFWVQVTTGLAKTIWPSPVGTLAVRLIGSWAEREADEVVSELAYSHAEICETRHRVLSFVAAHGGSLPFTADGLVQSSQSTPAQWRVAAAIAPISLVGALLPMVVMANPGLVGYQDALGPLKNAYAREFDSQYGDWTRQRYDVVFVDVGRLFRMRGDGSRRRLLRSGNFLEPSVSRDGSRIVAIHFDQDDMELWLMNGEGDAPVQLTDTPGFERHPSLSPDGRKVAYTVIQDGDLGKAQLMLLDLQSRTVANLSAQVGPGIEPTFGHDGSYVLYTNDGHIFRISVDGREKRPLTFGRNHGGAVQVDDHGPVPSPDGRFITFTRVQGDLESYWYRRPASGQVNLGYTISVWVMNADGSNPRELTRPVAGHVEYSVYGFAPTGIWIGYDRTETFKGGPDSAACEMDLLSGATRPILPGDNAGLSYTGWLR